MSHWRQTLYVALTMVGTVVGAGFATGQEIAHFFSRYGSIALWTIGLSTAGFMWVGTKMMTYAHDDRLTSFAQFNVRLFGKKWGGMFTVIFFLTLFGVSTVMLAGTGAIVSEHAHLPMGVGIAITVVLAYVFIRKGLLGVMTINVIVVPLMLLFALGLFYWMWVTSATPWTTLSTAPMVVSSPWRAGWAALSYVAFNLATAQAILIPLGATIANRQVIRVGGVLGGLLLGGLLWIGHATLTLGGNMLFLYEIPFGKLAQRGGSFFYVLYLTVVFAEIITTFVANVYGLTAYASHRWHWRYPVVLVGVLLLCTGGSFVGFKTLLGILYPFFGAISVLWLLVLCAPKYWIIRNTFSNQIPLKKDSAFWPRFKRLLLSHKR